MSDKDEKAEQQESKEFQMKVMWLNLDEEAILSPCVVDQQIFNLVKKAISSAVKELAEGQPTKLVFNDKVWRREGLRYDTESSTLKKDHNLTLAIEATDERTKLKCKEHNFIPELLFEKVEESPCYPDIQASKGYDKHGTKFKLEEDLHFSNLKFCASGSLFIEGRCTQVRTLEFFSRYFPNLLKLIPNQNTPLKILSHWDEAVFDDMSVEWDGTKFDDWMLVNRWEWGTNTLLESELSFKVEKKMEKDWKYDVLRKANQLYLALQKKSLFIKTPPIFFYNNPVSSVEICVCEKK